MQGFEMSADNGIATVWRTLVLVFIQWIAVQAVFAASDAEQLKAASNLMEQKKYSDAIAIFSDMIQSNPQCADCFLKRGLCECWSGSWTKGLEDFNRAIEIEPKRVDARVHRASAYTHLGDFEKALQDADYAIKVRPDLDSGYISRADALAKSGRYLEAELVLKSVASKVRSAQRLKDARQQIAIDEAMHHFARKSPQLALQAIERVTDWKRNAQLVNFHAHYLKVLGKDNDALREMSGAISLDPNNKAMRLTRVQWVQADDSKWKIAEEDLAAISVQCRNDSEYWAVKASLETEQGHLSKGQQAIEKAIANDSGNQQYRLTKAHLQMKQNQLAAAANELSQFLTLRPQCIDCYLLLAKIHTERHEFEKAHAALDKAVEKAENTQNLAAALEARGDFLFDTGDDRGALKDFGQALTLPNAMPALMKKRSRVLEELHAL